MEKERNALAMVTVSAEKNDIIALESVLVKRISEEYLTLFNTDGSLRKTAKSSCFSRFQDKLCSKLLQHSSPLLIWWLSGDLHPQRLMIVMQRHLVGQTTYCVITLIKCAQ